LNGGIDRKSQELLTHMLMPRIKSFLIGIALGLAVTVAVSMVLLVILNRNYSETLEDSNEQGEDTVEHDLEVSGTDSVSPMADEDQIRNFDLQQLRKLDSRFLRQYALYALTAGANEESLRELFNRSSEIDPSSLQHQIEETVIRKWATISPLNALNQIQGIPEVRFVELVRIVFSEWCLSDANAAFEYAQQNLDLPARQAVGEAIVLSRRDLARNELLEIAKGLGIASYMIAIIDKEMIENPVLDTESAWEAFVQEHRNNFAYLIGDKATLLEKIADSFVEQHGLEALDAIDRSTPNYDDKGVVLSRVLRRIAREHPEEALEFALGHTRDKRLLVGLVIGEWARRTPQATLDHLSNATYSNRVDYQAIALRGWIDTEGPLTVLTKMNRLPRDVRDLAEAMAISTFARTSPEQSVVWMREIANPTRKKRIAQSIAIAWAQKDPSAALDWVQSDPKIEDLRDELLSTTLRESARTNRALALETALSLSRKDSNVGFEAEVIRTVARRDIDAALELLPRSRNEETKLAGMRYIADSLIRIYNVEGVDRALELAEQLESEEVRTRYVESILPVWAMANPRDLYNRIEQLPSQEMKSLAAKTLIERDKENLSSEQARMLELLLVDMVED
jgi:hypothetical protein